MPEDAQKNDFVDQEDEDEFRFSLFYPQNEERRNSCKRTNSCKEFASTIISCK